MTATVNGHSDPEDISWGDLGARERRVLAAIAHFNARDRYAYGAELRRELWPTHANNQSTIYNILARLEGVGLVHDHNSKDNRIKDYGLTDAGERVLDSRDSSIKALVRGDL